MGESDTIELEPIDEEGTYRFDVPAGARISGTIFAAINAVREPVTTVQFEFNGVTVSVCADSDFYLIKRDWSRAMNGYIDKSVGPYPNPDLTYEEKENDGRIALQNEREQQERHAQYAQYEAAARKKREAVEAKLAGAPKMELADEEAWQQFKNNNQDHYGNGVVVYSERWAQLMQLAMSDGKTLEEVAEATSHEADTDGITGNMYGCAVATLAHCWKHGEQLRVWHNLNTQIGDEGQRANESGGVLNPAVLCVSG